MNYELLNAAGITFLALAGLWIFGKCVVQHKHADQEDPEKKTSAESRDADVQQRQIH